MANFNLSHQQEGDISYLISHISHLVSSLSICLVSDLPIDKVGKQCYITHELTR